ncbi:MAG: slipin family protein [Phycisphaerales bacterium]|nr:slipin family protein [Phycisphaerales bacterium]
MYSKVRIARYERGLFFRHKDFVGVLKPGVYRVPWFGKRTVQIVSTLNTRFEHGLLDVLITNEKLRSELVIVDLHDNQRALVWRDGRLLAIIGPGRHAYWRTPCAVAVDVYDVTDVTLAHDRLDAILAHADARKWLDGVEVSSHETALLFRDGKLVGRLTEGRHVFWKGCGRIMWRAVDLREQLAEVAGQEIMTSDKVTLRVNLIVGYRVTDPVKAVSTVADHAAAIYREAQLGLRAAIGTRSLDALLADKESVGGEVRNAVAKRAAEFGVEVRSVGLRDVILPGDMREILNQVITAEKESQANLIRRREETAAARSEANTAKLLAENPLLARMKELEAMKGLLHGAKLTLVLGQGDIANQLRTLVSGEAVKEVQAT